jgi:hypothetical protein
LHGVTTVYVGCTRKWKQRIRDHRDDRESAVYKFGRAALDQGVNHLVRPIACFTNKAHVKGRLPGTADIELPEPGVIEGEPSNRTRSERGIAMPRNLNFPAHNFSNAPAAQSPGSFAR